MIFWQCESFDAIIIIEIYLEDLSTTWARNSDHGGWIAVDDFSVA